jgi:hypothetical protein
MRHMIYKLQLTMDDGVSPYVFFATKDPNNIPNLLEKNRMWYEKDGRKVVKWKVLEQIPTIQMSKEKYEAELMMCDVVDEGPDDDLTEEEKKKVNEELGKFIQKLRSQ